MHPTITLLNPKSITREREFVLIPKREYETLLRKHIVRFDTTKLSARDKRAITAGERELRRGEYLTLDQLEYELGSARAKARH